MSCDYINRVSDNYNQRGPNIACVILEVVAQWRFVLYFPLVFSPRRQDPFLLVSKDWYSNSFYHEGKPAFIADKVSETRFPNASSHIGLKRVRRTEPDLEPPPTQKKRKLQPASSFRPQAVSQQPSFADVLARLKEDANSNTGLFLT